MVSIMLEHNLIRLGASLVFLNSGVNPPQLQLWGGERPIVAGDTPLGSLLVSIDLNLPAAELTTTSLVFSESRDGIVLLDGFVRWGRILTAGGQHFIDADASREGEGGDFIILNDQVYAGGMCRLLSGMLY